MMKEKKEKKKLKLYQKVLIAVFSALFIAATIILLYFYRNYIFTENTIARIILIALILTIGVGLILFKVLSGKDK